MQPFSIFSLGGVLLISIEEEINDSAIAEMLDLVSTTVSRRNLYGVIVDLQALEVMDSYLAGHLQQLARTLKLQHADMVVAGLSVPVVMTLLDFGIRLPDIIFALDVEQGLRRLHERNRTREDHAGL